MDLHIGEIIKRKAKEMRIGPTELGAMIDTSKQNVYGIYKRKSIDTHLLSKISKALEHDFFLYYVRDLEISSSEIILNPEEIQGSRNCLQKLELAQKEIGMLRQENQLLNKINELLEEKVKEG